MAQQRLGIIMNGVTGRMGTNQHLIRSIMRDPRRRAASRSKNGDRVMPDPILVGRNADKVAGARQGARHRALDHRSRRGARGQERHDLLRRRVHAASRRAAQARRSRPASTSTPRSRCADTLQGRARSRTARAKKAGVKHGVVQDKLWLPGLLKLKMLIDSGFFGRILSVRGEFGYWVFEGDWQPAQRPSWNYRKEDGGGIIVDMLCHWRYVLDNLFGDVKSVTCLGATHIPKRWDENGKAYDATADDAAYATFELAGRRHRADQQLVVHARAPRRSRDVPCRRHARLGGRRPAELLDPAAGRTRRGRCGIRTCRRRSTSSRRGRRCPGNRRLRQRASRSSGRCSSGTSSRARRSSGTCSKAPRACSSPSSRHKSWKERRWVDVPALKV